LNLTKSLVFNQRLLSSWLPRTMEWEFCPARQGRPLGLMLSD